MTLFVGIITIKVEQV